MNREEKQILTSLSRRAFIGTTGAGLLSALAGSEPLRAEPAAKIPPKADTVIVLWMAGGMAATETFDPKRYTAYEPGGKSADVLSTFKPIDTVVDNIKISEGLEHIAKVMDRGTLIRTFQAADLGFILHSRHQYHWHTGYAPPQSIAMPHLGAMIAKTLVDDLLSRNLAAAVAFRNASQDLQENLLAERQVRKARAFRC